MAKLIYICSAAHSGSTLLDLLLGSHSRIESLGEISFLGQDLAVNNRCTCGAPVRECHVWRAVVERLSAKLGVDIMARPHALPVGYPYVPSAAQAGAVDWKDENRAHFLHRKLLLGLYYSRLRFGVHLVDALLRSLHTMFAANLLTYETVRQVLGCDMVVDSSKFYLKALGVYLRNPLEARIILLTRDGRGVLGSNVKRNWPRDRSIIAWRSVYEHALPLLERHVDPAHMIWVKYEDVATHPAHELSRICAFLQVEFELGMLDFATVTHHSINGNNMRFVRSSQIRADNEWRERLSAQDLEYFERRAGRLNRRLGYA
jgi:hypothetical protein